MFDKLVQSCRDWYDAPLRAGTYVELASTLERTLQRPFERGVWTVPLLLEELAGNPDNMTSEYRAVFTRG